MAKKKKLPISIGEPCSKGSPIYNVRKEIAGNPQKKPAISITYLDNKGSYGLKYLFQKYTKHKGSRDILKEFNDFLDKVKQFDTIDEVMDAFTPRTKLKNVDPQSQQKIKEIQKEYHLDVSDMIHIHCCTKGTGQMVLHGFRIDNMFEIVWIDPDHERHKV